MSEKDKTQSSMKHSHKKKLEQSDYNRELEQNQALDQMHEAGTLDSNLWNNLRKGFPTIEAKFRAETHVLNSDTSSNKYLVSQLLPDLYKSICDFEIDNNKIFEKESLVVKTKNQKGEIEYKKLKLYITYIQGDIVRNFKGETATEKVAKALVASE